MNLVEQQTFKNETVIVDQTQFERCVFEDTVLVFGGTSLPTFVNCQFENVSLEFTDSAANTLKFLSALRNGGFAPAISKMIQGVRNKRF